MTPTCSVNQNLVPTLKISSAQTELKNSLAFQTGFYMPDVEIIRENYRVVQPAIPDARQAGYHIW